MELIKKVHLEQYIFFFFLDGSVLQIFITDITSCFAFSFAFLKETTRVGFKAQCWALQAGQKEHRHEAEPIDYREG